MEDAVVRERKASAMPPLLDLCLIRTHARAGEPPIRLGVPALDEYLAFVAGPETEIEYRLAWARRLT